MKGFGIRRYKGPIERLELPRPEPGPDDLLVRVRAASVNPLDFKIQSGGVKVVTPYRMPLVLGNDLSGDVEAVGAQVTRFKPGDAVYARLDKRWGNPVTDNPGAKSRSRGSSPLHFCPVLAGYSQRPDGSAEPLLVSSGFPAVLVLR